MTAPPRRQTAPLSSQTGVIKHPFAAPPEEGHATQVAPDILWMRLPLPMALDHVNVYALDEGESWTLIDTGIDWPRGRAIWQTLQRGPLQGKPVSRLIVTHHHPDHVGLAGWFQEQGAELWMTRTAWLAARMLVLDEQPRPSPEALLFYTRAGTPPNIIEARAHERPFNFCDMVAPMPEGFNALLDSAQITMGGRAWTVRFGSGHAPDHASFWAGDLVLGGDQLLPGISANIGVYPSEPNADPVKDWLDACRSFQPLARNSQLILPGHKLPYTGLPLRLVNMIENHEQALTRLFDHLKTPQTAHECFVPIFKREIKGEQYGLALAETIAHLNHLYHKGSVTRKINEQGAYIWQQRLSR